MIKSHNRLNIAEILVALRSDPLVLTGYSWIVIAIMGVLGEHLWLAIAPMVMGALSTNYHIRKTDDGEKLDRYYAYAYMAVGYYLLTDVTWIEGELVVTMLPGFWESNVAAMIAGLIYFIARSFDREGTERMYVIVHSLWHVVSASVSAVVYASYFGWIFNG